MALGELHHCIQVKIDESLETFSAEQRFHGERLDTIESLGRGLCGLVFFGSYSYIGQSSTQRRHQLLFQTFTLGFVHLIP
jgi:hypothetical protein